MKDPLAVVSEPRLSTNVEATPISVLQEFEQDGSGLLPCPLNPRLLPWKYDFSLLLLNEDQDTLKLPTTLGHGT